MSVTAASVARRLPSWQRYAVAGLSFVTSLAITLLIRGWSGGNEPFYPVFTAGVILAAWYGDLGPGLLAGVLSVLTNLLIVAGGGSHLMLPHTAELVRLSAFSLVVVFVSILAHARNRALARAREQAEALRDANARLAEADRRKDEFLAVLSHELRNPLAPIQYALPLLQRECSSEPATRAIGVIDRQAALLSRLVEDLLDVSRITRGKTELRRQLVTLNAIVNAAVEAASPAIEAARHTLNVSLPDEPVWLHADPARVAQVVTNLLNNSAKYTPRGGQITLDAKREDGQAVVRVRDTGIGIPADGLPTVFEMFHQVVDRPDRSQGGLGIGLALVRQLVEMHGGTVEARSAGVGQGAEFTVRLPITKSEAGASSVGDDAALRLG